MKRFVFGVLMFGVFGWCSDSVLISCWVSVLICLIFFVSCLGRWFCGLNVVFMNVFEDVVLWGCDLLFVVFLVVLICGVMVGF